MTPTQLDLNTNACIVERDFSHWGENDFFDICHNVHHVVPWTVLEYTVWGLAGLALIAVGLLLIVAIKVALD